MPYRLCTCGSGLPRTAQYDGHGIFMCFTCEKCEAERLSHFRPDIRTHYECDEPIEAE